TKREGNGFGLHSSALAVADMGGTISAHSDGEGHGAKFRIEFPLEAPEEAAPQSATIEAESFVCMPAS
ncbi:MAG: ATP-binding protein, partial [Planctomycetes bacterium]|nr:ATP-binding protein [Planctomycetota bacterium]